MSSWNNYAVIFKNSVEQDLKDRLEELGLKIYHEGDNVLKLTDFSGEEISRSQVEKVLQTQLETVNGYIHVDANDVSDTAYATAYTNKGGSLESVKNGRSGGESTRREWYGIRHQGTSLDGGKY